MEKKKLSISVPCVDGNLTSQNMESKILNRIQNVYDVFTCVDVYEKCEMLSPIKMAL